jgi:hypothetical protein
LIQLLKYIRKHFGDVHINLCDIKFTFFTKIRIKEGGGRREEGGGRREEGGGRREEGGGRRES